MTNVLIVEDEQAIRRFLRAALVIIQKMANVPSSKAKVANFVAFVGAMYSFYALYSSGEEAMLYGSIVTFLGWTLYGLVSPRFELKNKHG